jgi:hypothetical protein
MCASSSSWEMASASISFSVRLSNDRVNKLQTGATPRNRPEPTRAPRPSSFCIFPSSFCIPPIAPPDHPHSCNDVASMFLGCSLLVSSFLVPLFVPICPRSRHPRHAKTRALRPRLSPSAQAPIRSTRLAPRQPTVGTPNIETPAAWPRLQSTQQIRSCRAGRSAVVSPAFS